MQNITLTSPCLTSLKDHVLNNAEQYSRSTAGSFSEDNKTEEDWNVPRNYSTKDISDLFSYNFEVLLQNETEGLVKLLTLYEENDFLGWHTNSAVSGYNLILTYSDNEESYFETESGKVYDTLGWSYKLNEFGETPLWHRAYSKGNRITVSMLFSSLEDRTQAIETIQNLELDT